MPWVLRQPEPATHRRARGPREESRTRLRCRWELPRRTSPPGVDELKSSLGHPHRSDARPRSRAGRERRAGGFSEDVGISSQTLRDESFTVTEGDVTRARRVDGRNDLWEITVEPDSREAVTITLPGNRACGTTGAVCTRGDDPRPLTNSPSVEVEGPPAAPLTASFSDMPAEHTGERFTFGFTFSEDFGLSSRTLRNEAFEVGGTVRRARRKTQGSSQAWNIEVEPDAYGAVTIRLPETTDCDQSGAIRTGDGRPLSHSLSATVAGPVGISVADARVEEDDGAVLAFAVTLSRAASGTLSVDYATADGSARAGVDYTRAIGTLTFQSGESSKTIEVDVHDEGEETLTPDAAEPVARAADRRRGDRNDRNDHPVRHNARFCLNNSAASRSPVSRTARYSFMGTRGGSGHAVPWSLQPAQLHGVATPARDRRPHGPWGPDTEPSLCSYSGRAPCSPPPARLWDLLAAATRIVESILFGITPADPLTRSPPSPAGEEGRPHWDRRPISDLL